VRKSAVEAWLASYPFGYASQNLYVQCIKALFALAVDDKIIAESPATTIKAKKRVNPVRITPTFEVFLAIIHDVRHQQHPSDNLDSPAGLLRDFKIFKLRNLNFLLAKREETDAGWTT
jgi:hypothetical protein